MHRKVANSHSDKEVKYYSNCVNDVGVNLKDEDGQTKRFERQVGVCWFSPGMSRCVTKGLQNNTIYHYDYNSRNKLCSDPKQMNYTLSSGGFFAFLK